MLTSEYFKEDLGWFSVFISIGFSFYQPQIGSQTYHQMAFDDMFVSQFVVGRKRTQSI